MLSTPPTIGSGQQRLHTTSGGCSCTIQRAAATSASMNEHHLFFRFQNAATTSASTLGNLLLSSIYFHGSTTTSGITLSGKWCLTRPCPLLTPLSKQNCASGKALVPTSAASRSARLHLGEHFLSSILFLAWRIFKFKSTCLERALRLRDSSQFELQLCHPDTQLQAPPDTPQLPASSSETLLLYLLLWRMT